MKAELYKKVDQLARTLNTEGAVTNRIMEMNQFPDALIEIEQYMDDVYTNINHAIKEVREVAHDLAQRGDA